MWHLLPIMNHFGGDTIPNSWLHNGWKWLLKLFILSGPHVDFVILLFSVNILKWKDWKKTLLPAVVCSSLSPIQPKAPFCHIHRRQYQLPLKMTARLRSHAAVVTLYVRACIMSGVVVDVNHEAAVAAVHPSQNERRPEYSNVLVNYVPWDC